MAEQHQHPQGASRKMVGSFAIYSQPHRALRPRAFLWIYSRIFVCVAPGEGKKGMIEGPEEEGVPAIYLALAYLCDMFPGRGRGPGRGSRS